MWNFQDTFETVKQSFISAFSICMTVPLSYLSHAISPYLHGNSINWTNAFYLCFCCTIFTHNTGCILSE